MKIVDLGRISYAEAEALQLERVAEVRGGAEDTLYLLEHDPVVTIGRHGGAENLLLGERLLADRGVALHRSARGGLATCHFPGQLVVYFVLRLDRRPGGVRGFFQDMQEAAVATAKKFGVQARVRPDFPGAWVEDRKLCSVGAAVRRWVSYHGLALNVGPDLSLFDLITPCGIQGVRMTSLSCEAGRDIPVEDAKHVFRRHFPRR